MNSKIINIALVMVVLALTGLATLWLDQHRGASAPPGTSESVSQGSARAPAPNTTLRTLAGERIVLHNYKGKIVLLNFWATWCVPCIAEWPQFIKLAKALPEDVVILAVSIDDDKAKIAPFMKRYAKSYAQHKNIVLLHDTDKSVSQDLFQTVRVPETVIIAPDMTMARKVAGLSVEWDSAEMKDYLLRLKEIAP